MEEKTEKRKYAVNRSRLWQCPYFTWDGVQCVRCEAGKIDFLSKRNAEDYMTRFCANVDGWKNCTIARQINIFYETQEEKSR